MSENVVSAARRLVGYTSRHPDDRGHYRIRPEDWFALRDALEAAGGPAEASPPVPGLLGESECNNDARLRAALTEALELLDGWVHAPYPKVEAIREALDLCPGHQPLWRGEHLYCERCGARLDAPDEDYARKPEWEHIDTILQPRPREATSPAWYWHPFKRVRGDGR